MIIPLHLDSTFLKYKTYYLLTTTVVFLFSKMLCVFVNILKIKKNSTFIRKNICKI